MKNISYQKVNINSRVIKEVNEAINLFGEDYLIQLFETSKLKKFKIISQKEFSKFLLLDDLSFTEFFSIINGNYNEITSIEDELHELISFYINNSQSEEDEYSHKLKGSIRACEILQRFNINLSFLPKTNLEKSKVLISQKLLDAMNAFLDEHNGDWLIYVFENNKMNNKKFSSANNNIYCNLAELDEISFNDFFKLMNGYYEVNENLSMLLEKAYKYYLLKSRNPEFKNNLEGFIATCEIMQKHGYDLKFLQNKE